MLLEYAAPWWPELVPSPLVRQTELVLFALLMSRTPNARVRWLNTSGENYKTSRFQLLDNLLIEWHLLYSNNIHYSNPPIRSYLSLEEEKETNCITKCPTPEIHPLACRVVPHRQHNRSRFATEDEENNLVLENGSRVAAKHSEPTLHHLCWDVWEALDA